MESLAEITAQATGQPEAEIRIKLRPPLTYQSNRLYDVWIGSQHLIAKEFLKPAELQDASTREYRALQLLAPLDIAPRPVFFDPALGAIVFYAAIISTLIDLIPHHACFPGFPSYLVVHLRKY